MANRSVFTTKGVGLAGADTRNLAGGRAYSFNDEHALAQGIVTSCFNKTFYADEQSQLDTILKLSLGCTPEFVAKAAVYGHEQAKMKDAPALMLATLTARGKVDPNSGTPPTLDQLNASHYLTLAFPRVISRTKMLMNFVQFIRSGKVGVRSFGGLTKRLIREWLSNHSPEWLFKGSIGSNPSFADILKLIHPDPVDDERRAFYGYMLGREYNSDHLPELVKQYEMFKKGLLGNNLLLNDDVPSVPFQLLTSLPLKPEHWKAIARNLPWNALRMNLNTLARHEVLEDRALVNELAAKLADPAEVRKNNVFPYQLFTAFQHMSSDIPTKLKNALQDAMEFATLNIPSFGPDGVAVLVDTSSSMRYPVTGHRVGSTTKTTCVEVAALIAASIARKNDDTLVLPFDTTVHPVHDMNFRDSVMTNAQKLSRYGGGGTDVSAGLRVLNSLAKNRPKVVIIVSDNESWFRTTPRYGWGNQATDSSQEWDNYQRRTSGAKLICIDLNPNTTTQVKDAANVLNIGGFSDNVWAAIDRFVRYGNTDFVSLIKDSVQLDKPVISEQADNDNIIA